jgi:quercetin dioxygenase-like cupin family protein
MPDKKNEFKIWNSPEIIDWGPAKVRFYVKNDKMLFGTLTVPKRTVGLVDQGHENGEYLYCLKGSFDMVLIYENGKKETKEVHEGDSVFVPEKIDHQIINNSEDEVINTFAIIL